MAAALLRNHISNPGDIRLLDTLDRCAERGAALVRQILGFVHGIGGEPRVIQLKHLLRDIVEVAHETFPKSIVLEDNVPNELWPVVVNPTQIHQVMLNLCVNARDAMPDGGALRLSAENISLDDQTALSIEGATPGAWLMLEIADTGTGIPPGVLAQMWQPFFTTKAPDKGTGLGLSTVRGIVETHHGFITVQTAAGRGTTFRIYLPAAESAVPLVSSESAPLAVRGRGELILLADDEPSIRDAADTVLRHAGYRVVTASDGSEAATLFESRAGEFALVITDVDMPNVGGAALAGVIRAFSPHLKILAMSGLASRDSKIKPSEFADAFIAKPFRAEVLLSNVSRLLNDKSGRERSGGGPVCSDPTLFSPIG
jgi:two-component system, cell cycle sensor histidine kinase and response regulator CckA